MPRDARAQRRNAERRRCSRSVPSRPRARRRDRGRGRRSGRLADLHVDHTAPGRLEPRRGRDHVHDHERRARRCAPRAAASGRLLSSTAIARRRALAPLPPHLPDWYRHVCHRGEPAKIPVRSLVQVNGKAANAHRIGLFLRVPSAQLTARPCAALTAAPKDRIRNRVANAITARSWTWRRWCGRGGRAFPLSRLESRLRCPRCGSRYVVVL